MRSSAVVRLKSGELARKAYLPHRFADHANVLRGAPRAPFFKRAACGRLAAMDMKYLAVAHCSSGKSLVQPRGAGYEREQLVAIFVVSA